MKRSRRIALAVGLVLSLLTPSGAYAHEGFQVRLEDADVDGYTLTVLDDIHQSGSGVIVLFVEIDGEPAPEDTTVSVMLQPLGQDSFDLTRAEYSGSTFYLERQRAMYIAVPLIFEVADHYQMQVFLSGVAGQTEIMLEISALPPAQE